MSDNQDKTTGNIDLRYQRKYRTLGAFAGFSKYRILHLDCEFCGNVKHISVKEQQEIIKNFKSPIDFKMIECPCGRSQWILASKFVRQGYPR